MNRLNKKCDVCKGEMNEEEYEGFVELQCEDCGNYIRLYYDDNNEIIDEY